MIDTHVQRSAPGRIPILSPIVHCVAMTTLVYLRSSFGFVFLRPKSVFFAFSWAFTLFAIAAWNEPELWGKYRAACIFGIGAIALYWVHLLITVSRELYHSGRHDHYSGTSHFLSLFRRFGNSKASAERILHLWVEPGFALLTALVFRFALGERRLSAWLILTAACMLCKEFMNYWAAIRRDKILDDSLLDAERRGDALPDKPAPHQIPKPVRKEPVKRHRNAASAEYAARESRFAELLRLRIPYTLEDAEQHFLTLIKLAHPDATEQSPENNSHAAELNEAIEFFRKRFTKL